MAAGGARSSANPMSGNVARRIIARMLFAAVVVIDLVLGIYVVRLYYLHPRTDDAYVRANIVGVAPEVSGTIVELPCATISTSRQATCYSSSIRVHIKPNSTWPRRGWR